MIKEPNTAAKGHGRPKVTDASDNEQSFADLASTVLRNASALVRAEMRLARAELKESATLAAKGLALLAGAVALGLATAVMSLVTLLAILVAIGMPLWLAAILTTLVAGIGTAGLALQGVRHLRANELMPGRAMEQMNKDRLAVKEQIQ